MKRKLAALLLSAVMACSILAGCSDSSTPPSNPTPPSSSSSTATNPPSDDNNTPPTKDDSEKPSESTPDSTPNSSSTETPDSNKKLELQFDSFDSNIIRTNVTSYNVFAFYTITNPNPTYDVSFVRINYQVKDVNGTTVKTGWDYVPSIAAGDTIQFGTALNVSSQAAIDGLSYTLDYGSCTFTDHTDTQFAKQTELVVSDVTRVPSSYSYFTGKVTNGSSSDIDNVTVKLFYVKNGKFIACDAAFPCSESAYTGPLKAGKTVSFKALTTYEPEDYDSYVTFVNVRYSYK